MDASELGVCGGQIRYELKLLESPLVTDVDFRQVNHKIGSNEAAKQQQGLPS